MPAKQPVTYKTLGQRNHAIAQGHMAGKTYRELREQFGISIAQISRILNADEIQEVIEEGAKRVIALIPKAEQNLAEFLASEDDAVRWKATKKVLETGGILPGHGLNVTIQNLTIDNRKQTINAQVQAVLNKAMGEIIGE